MMDDTDQQYYSMEFIEEEGKTFVIFFNQEGELVAKRGERWKSYCLLSESALI
jgi:hypothetical protein